MKYSNACRRFLRTKYPERTECDPINLQKVTLTGITINQMFDVADLKLALEIVCARV